MPEIHVMDGKRYRRMSLEEWDRERPRIERQWKREDSVLTWALLLTAGGLVLLLGKGMFGGCP